MTLILSYTAMIALSATTQINNEDALLRLHALNLADQQFAMVESLVAQGESVSNFNGNENDLKSLGLYRPDKNKKTPTEFKVTTNISGEGTLRKVKITVTWKNNTLELEKIVRAKEE